MYGIDVLEEPLELRTQLIEERCLAREDRVASVLWCSDKSKYGIRWRVDLEGVVRVILGSKRARCANIAVFGQTMPLVLVSMHVLVVAQDGHMAWIDLIRVSILLRIARSALTTSRTGLDRLTTP